MKFERESPKIINFIISEMRLILHSAPRKQLKLELYICEETNKIEEYPTYGDGGSSSAPPCPWLAWPPCWASSMWLGQPHQGARAWQRAVWMIPQVPHLWGVSRSPGRRETEAVPLPATLDRWEQRGGGGVLGWYLK
jgi:hypothetical protein